METASEFKKQGYIVIKNMIDPGEIKHLYDYTVKNAPQGNPDDGQVPGSPSFYMDKEIVALETKYQSIIEAALQMKLWSVFCYHRVYRKGAVLKAHKDSSRAEISASINIGQQGEPWDLWLLDYDENTRRITLAPGDVLVYHGNQLMHWREKLVNSDFVSQAMFHFVPATLKNKWIVKMEMLRKWRKRCRQTFGMDY